MRAERSLVGTPTSYLARSTSSSGLATPLEVSRAAALTALTAAGGGVALAFGGATAAAAAAAAALLRARWAFLRARALTSCSLVIACQPETPWRRAMSAKSFLLRPGNGSWLMNGLRRAGAGRARWTKGSVRGVVMSPANSVRGRGLPPGGHPGRPRRARPGGVG